VETVDTVPPPPGSGQARHLARVARAFPVVPLL